MNTFLADWRNHKPTHMDPRLFDLLWEVYQDVGGNQPYSIVSAYRTPETNAALRARSKAVAEHSQHMLGHAMDVFIQGVPLATLRAAAMRHQVGGVGYYPTSGSPFVHMDTGSVRAWPRMTRAQLEKVFPDGNTLHLPVDGKPLSNSGRLYAQAQWSKCHMVPCSGDGSVPLPSADDEVRVASLDPAQRTVSTITINAPTPFARSGAGGTQTVDLMPDGDIIVPFSKTPQMMVATREILPSDGQTALGAIDDNTAPVPAPRILMTPRSNPVLTAYAPEITPEPGAELALKMLIERETTASAPVPLRIPAPHVDPGIRTASLGGTNGLNVSSNIFDMTFTAVTQVNGRNAIVNALTRAAMDPAPMTGVTARAVDLVAPELDHVNETLTTAVPMTDMHYADMTEPEGYLDNAAELGAFANHIVLESDLVAPPRYDRFIVRRPMLIASRG
jgi:hypothetical protein